MAVIGHGFSVFMEIIVFVKILQSVIIGITYKYEK